MSNLFFLSTLFPSFSLSEPHLFSMEDLEFALEQNLSSRELQEVNDIWLLGDVSNIRSYLKNEPMIAKGSLEIEKLTAIMAAEEKAPKWLAKYFEEFPTEEERLSHNFLLSRYCLVYASKESIHPAVRTILRFDFCMRSVLEYARKGSLSSDLGSTEIAFIHEPKEEWPEEYQRLFSLWNMYKTSPMELEDAISTWKFAYLDSQKESSSPFSLSRLIYSIALFNCLESRRPLVDEVKHLVYERIVKALS